jgi:hypothetical protein
MIINIMGMFIHDDCSLLDELFNIEILAFFRHIFIEAHFSSFIMKIIPNIVSLLVQLFRLLIEGGMLDYESLDNHKV